MAHSKLFYALGFALLAPACAKHGTTPETRGANSVPVPQGPAIVAEEPYRGEPLPAPPPDAPLVTSAELPPATAAAHAQSALTDGQIIEITEQVNAGEIAQATLARSKAQSNPVKQFAMHMLSEHSRAQHDGQSLAKQSRLAPAGSATATDVSMEGEAALTSLKSADPASFDRAYIGLQIKQHEHVLKLLDEQLIPGSVDPGLRAQLGQARLMVAAHLQEAQKIQQTLLSASSETPPQHLVQARD